MTSHIHVIEAVVGFSLFRWGCDHEKIARNEYVKLMKIKHSNVKVNDSGFIINPKWPHIGASPDGILSCSCCRPRLIEIKCPTCRTIQEVTESRNYLTPDGISKTHAYYYQVQCQLSVAEYVQADFVVWTSGGISIHTIQQDEKFWESAVVKSSEFFIKCLLPELLAKWFTRHPLNCDKVLDLTNVWCYCRRTTNEKDLIVTCSNLECSIKNYHLNCLRLKSVPKKQWLCYDCRAIQKAKEKS